MSTGRYPAWAVRSRPSITREARVGRRGRAGPGRLGSFLRPRRRRRCRGRASAQRGAGRSPRPGPALAQRIQQRGSRLLHDVGLVGLERPNPFQHSRFQVAKELDISESVGPAQRRDPCGHFLQEEAPTRSRRATYWLSSMPDSMPTERGQWETRVRAARDDAECFDACGHLTRAAKASAP